MKEKKIYIAGDDGFVGTNLKNYLKSRNYKNFISTPKDLDLRRQDETSEFIRNSKPDIIILAAGKVGGILANKKYPAEFLYDNLMIWSNIIKSAADIEVEKLIFLGSATVYPKDANPPYKEETLFTGKLDKNIEPYAIAKISAIKLCETYYKEHNLNFYALTLANLYGPHDHFDDENSHVVPALISNFYKAKKESAKEVELWGTGKPTRDLLYVEDLAEAIEFSMNNVNASDIYKQGISHINIGTGTETSIKELALTIAGTLEFKGDIKFDITKPDGTMRKAVDASRINELGWKAATTLEEGINKTVNYYLETKNKVK